MYRLGRWCAGVLLLIAAATRGAAGDDVARYLERHGLTELLAVHLERQLEQAAPEQRGELLVRLAGLYASLLEEIQDEARRRDLEQRSRRLLAAASEEQTGELRLALLRAAYRSVEKAAGNHRLRLATDEELERAKASLVPLIPELKRLRERFEERAESVQRRLTRAAGSRAIMLGEELEKARRVQSECAFLNAWALYYQSWLNDRPDNARPSQRLFAELLDFGSEPPVPENVSVDLRSTEAIARCILGMALCKSLTASSATAIAWAELLEHQRTFRPVREEVPAWEMVIYLEHDEHDAARRVLDDYLAGDTPVPMHWLRLLAVHALEAGDRSRDAEALARYAITELATRGELAQVFDLAQRYGVNSLGTGGFALRYVTGVLKYYEARERHVEDEPTDDPEIRRLYEDAGAEIEAARAESDADRYPSAFSDCLRLIAWCHYFRGDLPSARRAFEEAAAQLSAPDAPDALWMAIVCLDRLTEANPRDTALADELARLIARFLDEYPSSTHAPKLILRCALTSSEISPDVVDQLLAIPSHSEAYDAARRRAAQILYRLFRDASGPRQTAYGNRYLSVALALHAQRKGQLDPSDSPGLSRFLIRGRRILEVSLHERIVQLEAARAVLKSFEELRPLGLTEISELQSEISYRRVQEGLLSGDVRQARRVADAMWHDAPEDVWSRLAVRALYKYGRNRWRDARGQGEDDRPFVALVVDYGSRVLEEYADQPAMLEQSSIQALHAVVAEASLVIWQRSGDLNRAEHALAIYEKLLEMLPRNAAFLRATAILCEALDRPERAVDCWRTLVAGTSQTSDAWYEAKFHLIKVLAEIDRERARAVMNQHKQLNPAFGPIPWGEKLRTLDQQLTAAEQRPAGSPEEAGP